jgi:ribosomal protein S18 acetylase RimI-like enzyme
MNGQKIIIRNYRPGDDDRVIEITKRAWPEVTLWKKMEDLYGPRAGKPWWHYKITPLLNFAKSNPKQFFVAELEGKPVGYAMFSLDAETKIGTVLDNAVDPACQGLGLGSALHREVLLALKNAGMEIFKVCTGLHQTAARKMYEKHGFKEVFQESIYLMSANEAKI